MLLGTLVSLLQLQAYLDHTLQKRREIAMSSTMRPLYRSLQPHLGEIRLVKIRRGRFDSPIELDMMQGPLSRLATQRGYQALSYTWGDAKDTRQITLNDQPFQATKNLESALRQLTICARRRYQQPGIGFVD
jgi:hypothetical protein